MGQLDDRLVLERPGHDAVDVPAQDAGHILDRLAFADAADVFRLDVDRMAAQVRHRDLKAHPRPQARLLEEHGQRLAGQAQIAPAGLVECLERAALVEQLVQLLQWSNR